MLLNLIATVAAKYTIHKNRFNFNSGKITHQSIYFELDRARKLEEPLLSKRVVYLISLRYKCSKPQSIADVIICDSLNQFANLLPSEPDIKKLIYNMYKNSYESMSNVHNVVSQSYLNIVEA